MKDEILDLLIKEIPRVLKTDLPDLNENTNYKTELSMKSFEIVAVLTAIEDEYDAYIKYTSIIHCNTLGEMAEEIANQLS